MEELLQSGASVRISLLQFDSIPKNLHFAGQMDLTWKENIQTLFLQQEISSQTLTHTFI